MPTLWCDHAGHVHEYTPPEFFNVYTDEPEPFTFTDWPSARSALMGAGSSPHFT
jgi:hypothetical protein